MAAYVGHFGPDWTGGESQKKFKKWADDVSAVTGEAVDMAAVKQAIYTAYDNIAEGIHAGGWGTKEDLITQGLTAIGLMDSKWPGVLDWLSTYYAETSKGDTRIPRDQEGSMYAAVMAEDDSPAVMRGWKNAAGWFTYDGLIWTPFAQAQKDDVLKADWEDKIKEHKKMEKDADVAAEKEEARLETEEARKGRVEAGEELSGEDKSKFLLQRKINEMKREEEREKDKFMALHTPKERTMKEDGTFDKAASDRNALRDFYKNEAFQKEEDLKRFGKEMPFEEREKIKAGATQAAVGAEDIRLATAKRDEMKARFDKEGIVASRPEEDVLQAQLNREMRRRRLAGEKPMSMAQQTQFVADRRASGWGPVGRKQQEDIAAASQRHELTKKYDVNGDGVLDKNDYIAKDEAAQTYKNGLEAKVNGGMSRAKADEAWKKFVDDYTPGYGENDDGSFSIDAERGKRVMDAVIPVDDQRTLRDAGIDGVTRFSYHLEGGEGDLFLKKGAGPSGTPHEGSEYNSQQRELDRKRLAGISPKQLMVPGYRGGETDDEKKEIKISDFELQAEGDSDRMPVVGKGKVNIDAPFFTEISEHSPANVAQRYIDSLKRQKQAAYKDRRPGLGMRISLLDDKIAEAEKAKLEAHKLIPGETGMPKEYALLIPPLMKTGHPDYVSGGKSLTYAEAEKQASSIYQNALVQEKEESKKERESIEGVGTGKRQTWYRPSPGSLKGEERVREILDAQVDEIKDYSYEETRPYGDITTDSPTTKEVMPGERSWNPEVEVPEMVTSTEGPMDTGLTGLESNRVYPTEGFGVEVRNNESIHWGNMSPNQRSTLTNNDPEAADIARRRWEDVRQPEIEVPWSEDEARDNALEAIERAKNAAQEQTGIEQNNLAIEQARSDVPELEQEVQDLEARLETERANETAYIMELAKHEDDKRTFDDPTEGLSGFQDPAGMDPSFPPHPTPEPFEQVPASPSTPEPLGISDPSGQPLQNTPSNIDFEVPEGAYPETSVWSGLEKDALPTAPPTQLPPSGTPDIAQELNENPARHYEYDPTLPADQTSPGFEEYNDAPPAGGPQSLESLEEGPPPNLSEPPGPIPYREEEEEEIPPQAYFNQDRYRSLANPAYASRAYPKARVPRSMMNWKFQQRKKPQELLNAFDAYV